MQLFRLALVLVGVAALAACQGTSTVGTMGEPQPPGSASSSDPASTSGAGDDSVTGTDTTIAADASGSPQHPLDDPAGVLATRTIYFEFDSSEVPAAERSTIEAHARYLSEHSGASITLEGHADERGSREYNIALGEQRAGAVRQLMTLLGAATPQIRAVSYGEERPAAVGHDESAWRLNRRVEIVYRVRE